jgi:hypothetical protein
LDLNLRREEIGEDGERGSNQLWQELSEVLIRGIVVLDIFPRPSPHPGESFWSQSVRMFIPHHVQDVSHDRPPPTYLLRLGQIYFRPSQRGIIPIRPLRFFPTIVHTALVTLKVELGPRPEQRVSTPLFPITDRLSPFPPPFPSLPFLPWSGGAVSYLLVLPLLDGLLHWLDQVFSLYSRSDHPVVDGIDLLQILAQVIIFLTESARPTHDSGRGFPDGAGGRGIGGTEDWHVYGFEFAQQTVLGGQDGRPCVAPCLHRVDDLNQAHSLG